MIFLYILGFLIILTKGKPLIHSATKSTYFNLSSKYGRLYGIETELILAVIQQESAGNPFAVSNVGAFGLMQIMQPALTDFNDNTGHSLSIFDMFDPSKNMMVGVWYLRHLQSAFNLSLYDALRAYNVGIGTIRKSSTAGKNYADSVMLHFNKMKG